MDIVEFESRSELREMAKLADEYPRYQVVVDTWELTDLERRLLM